MNLFEMFLDKEKNHEAMTIMLIMTIWTTGAFHLRDARSDLFERFLDQEKIRGRMTIITSLKEGGVIQFY